MYIKLETSWKVLCRTLLEDVCLPLFQQEILLEYVIQISVFCLFHRPPAVVSDSTCGRFVFDRHILGEIAELEQDEVSSRAPPKSDAEVYGHLMFTTSYDDQEQR